MDRGIMERCHAKLIDVAQVRGTITYGDLARFLHVANQSVGVYLDPIYEEEIAQGRPDLTVVVVYPKTGMGRYNSRGRHVRSVKVDSNNDDDVRAYRDELNHVYEYWSREPSRNYPPGAPTRNGTSRGTFSERILQGDSGYSTMSDLSWENFELGFWHPFGPHSRETAEDIIHRKRRETERNGWTLWSFKYRTRETLDEWYRALSSAKQRGPVFVFCSRSCSSVDPAAKPGARAEVIDCKEYRLVGHDDAHWQPIPNLIRVPHSFNPGKTVVFAFVVRRVHHPIKPFQHPAVRWLSLGKWHEERPHTRLEFLIRRGGKIAMPDVSAVLELKPPYLAVVKR